MIQHLKASRFRPAKPVNETATLCFSKIRGKNILLLTLALAKVNCVYNKTPTKEKQKHFCSPFFAR